MRLIVRGGRVLFRLGALALAICAATVPPAVGAPMTSLTSDPRVQGGTDGAGSLPKATSPSPSTPLGTTHSDIASPTVGVVIDIQSRQPIPDALIIVLDALGEPIATAITDAQGKFLVYLLDEPGLELCIPSEGVAGVEIHAGEKLLVLVP